MTTEHARELELSARIEAKGTRHAQIGVFQNGGKAGVLVVDTEHAARIVGLIAAAPDLLKMCENTAEVLGTVYANSQEETAAMMLLSNKVHDVIAKATP